MSDPFTAQNLFSALQRAIVQRLTAGLGEWYNLPEGLVVIAEDKADVETEILLRTSKPGICLFLILSAIKRGEADKQRDVTVQISGFENVTLNRGSTGTRVALVDLLAATDGLLDGWEPAMDGITLGFTPLQYEDHIPVALGQKEDPVVERGSYFSTSVFLAVVK